MYIIYIYNIGMCLIMLNDDLRQYMVGMNAGND